MDVVDAKHRQLIVRTRRLDGAVEVAVTDTGPGIPFHLTLPTQATG